MPVVVFNEAKYPLTKLPVTKLTQDPDPYADLFALFNTVRKMWLDLDESFGSLESSIAGFITEAPIDGVAYVRKDGDWVPESGGGGGTTWGSITGTLSAQTDLATALSGKEPTITVGTTAQYWRGDKSWQTLPSPGIGEAPNDGQQYARQSLGWAVVAGGGGGSVGENIILTANRIGSSSSYRGYTVFGYIPAGRIANKASKIKFSMWVNSPGNFVIGALKILTTALGSTTVTSSTTVTVGGSATPTIVNPSPGTFFRITTDDITKTIDATQDYWLAVYFDSGSANNMNVGTMDSTSDLKTGFLLGNHTGVSTIPISSPIGTGLYALVLNA